MSQGLPLALDIQRPLSPYSFGRRVLDLEHAGVAPLYDEPSAQAWVAWIAQAANRFAASAPAAHYPLSCGF